MKRFRVVPVCLAMTLLASVPAPAADVDPVPRIESVHMTLKTFAVAKRNTLEVARRHRVRRGTRIRVTLSSPGLLELLAQKRDKGRASARGGCVPETHRNRKRPACDLITTRMRIFRPTARKGRNRFIFTGRAPGVVLRPGPYQFTITASNGVTDSAPEVVRFRIVPG
jgi:hypothetical protein